jgi:hypothetical protein
VLPVPSLPQNTYTERAYQKASEHRMPLTHRVMKCAVYASA